MESFLYPLNKQHGGIRKTSLPREALIIKVTARWLITPVICSASAARLQHKVILMCFQITKANGLNQKYFLDPSHT